MDETLQKFILEHAKDDTSKLLLFASRYQDVDIRRAVVQIEARRKIKDKAPDWYWDDRLIYPSALAAEQCSSALTAMYKQRFVQGDDILYDLTGGLGIDTFYFAQKAKQVLFIEQNKAYCEAALANFQTLGLTNVQVIHNDAFSFLKEKNNATIFYIDPSRRGRDNRRLFSISDCEPDISKIYPLLPASKKLIIKLSPMLDITQALTCIPSVQEVHILSIKNECKELLIVTAPLAQCAPLIHCVNILVDNTEQTYTFHFPEEQTVVSPIAVRIGQYLFEPNASLLKAGAFKTVAMLYGVEKLHTNSHLYTSDQLVASFPGRCFEIMDVLPFSNRLCKTIALSIPHANISVRNFPLTVEELRKRTRISDGGDIYLFATTIPDNQKALIKCRKPS